MLDKTTIEALCERLRRPGGTVSLLCDGDCVTLRVEKVKDLNWRVITYVNGVFKLSWISFRSNARESRYLRPAVTRLYSPAKTKQLEKQFGKRKAREFFALDSVITTYRSDWASGKVALRHLIKVCSSITVLDGGAV